MKKNILFSDYTIGTLLTLLVVGCFYMKVPFFERMELMFYDGRAKLRKEPIAARKGDEVSIVAIDENSLADSDLGKWPWPRAHIAALIDKISEGQPKVIALSILFSEPDENQGLKEIINLQSIYAPLVLQKKIKEPKDYTFLAELSSAEVRLDNDARLRQSLETSGKVMMALSFDYSGTPTEETIPDDQMPAAFTLSELKSIENKNEENIFFPPEATGAGLPLEDFASLSKGAGNVSVEPDSDGILRREIPVTKFMGRYFPSFSLQAVRAYLGVEPADVKVRWGSSIQIGKTFIPLDDKNRMAISYLEPGTSFKYYSVSDIMKGKDNPEVFKDKIVLIGFTASGFGNPFSTPLGSNSLQPIEYFAQVIQNILHRNFIVRPSWTEWAELGSLIFVGLFIMLVLPRVKAGTGFALSLVLAILLIAPATYTFAKDGFWIKLFYAFFLLILGYTAITLKKFFLSEKKEAELEQSEIETNKMLGLSFQGQGQLDLAFEKFRKCPVDDGMKDSLYNLGLDFERKRQFNKAAAVYEFIGKTDPKFKDIESKIDMLKKAADGMVFGGALGGKGSKDGGGTVMIDSASAKPTLGRYEIIKELGRGAMGVVYLGKDPKINRTVAIKTMMFDDEVDEKTLKDLKERFFREAESAGKLSHPNIVRIFDAGDDQDMAYIAMELMEGDDFKKWSTKETLMPIPQVLDYIAKVADALDYAHQEGVFHRDIKPANIMLLKDGTVRVADFGIARIQGTSKTATGTVMGTPSYMSPEQIAGKRVDGRSDLFSLGVTLYELLTGEKPFKGGDAIGTLLFQIANDPHPDPRTVRPEIPPCAVEAINKALEKNSDKRYQRGGEMAADLKNCLAAIGGAVSAGPATGG